MKALALIIASVLLCIILVFFTKNLGTVEEKLEVDPKEQKQKDNSQKKHYCDSLTVAYRDSALVDPLSFDVFTVKRLSKILRVLDEGALYNKTQNASDETWRLIMLPTFGIPITVRLSQKSGNYYLASIDGNRRDSLQLLTIVFKSRYGSEDILRTANESQLPLGSHVLADTSTTRKWNQIRQTISLMDFWKQPKTLHPNEYSMDGTRVILEGLHQGKYHFIERSLRSKTYQRNNVDRTLPQLIRQFISIVPTNEQAELNRFFLDTWLKRY